MRRLSGIALLSVLVTASWACGRTGLNSGTKASQSAAVASAAADPPAGLYVRRDLVSDGFLPAEQIDPNLVNSWGIAHLATSPWWVADNGTGEATLYDGDGIPQFPGPTGPLVVTVTGAGGQAAAPSGIAANPTNSFVVSSGGASGPARFIFASEDGTISAWNPNVPTPPKGLRSTVTIVEVDNSSSDPLGGSVYKGLALASTEAGDRLYATDFRQGLVAVFDGSWAPVSLPGGFVDPGIPAGFAPFGIALVEEQIVVTYAKQDDQKHDDVAGAHLGYVSAFTTDGELVGRVASRGKLNSPWGIALAPDGFGKLAGTLLIGNFGDGHIMGYRRDSADTEGQYLTTKGGRITIDGLWGIGFGNDSAAGPSDALFFASGPDGEAHGLFGRIDVASASGK